MAATAGKRAVAGHGPRIGETGKFEGDFKVQANPPFLQDRLAVWDRLYTKYQADLKAKPRKPIKVELPDGAVKEGTAFETTPMSIAQGISKKLADEIIVAKLIYKESVDSLKACVNADADSDEDEDPEEQSVLWDTTRPLEGSCRMELLKIDNPEGQNVFWHSTAHILGQAMERKFGCHLTIGPALENGFYYDGFFGARKLGTEDFTAITEQATQISKEKQPYERCVISKEDALELFAGNPFKVQLITNKVPDGAMTSCYRCGQLVDLCRGPHIPDTGKCKAFMITKNSAAYWLGDQKLDSLQRVYGISFTSEKEMKAWQKFQEEAAKRDHRKIGTQQDLLFWHQTASPGSTFWYPMGTRIYNKLVDFMRSEYRLRGFTEVITPNMYSSSLYMRSGHYQNYKDGMYSLDIEKEEYCLKPMNCPGHYLMFESKVRSYKELPIRYADFGVLHRNEASGALSGLTRVRRFQQDDAHIFARPEQIKQEVTDALNFLKFVYKIFGFSCTYALSTRPKKALGAKEIWDDAENQLKAALNESGIEWTLNPGDGAFYGPKIDIRLMDAMKRKHQCGTIQLDFQMPIRFNLQYKKEGVEEDEAADGDASPKKEEEEKEFQGAVEKNAKGEIIWREGKLKNGFERPVVIHRAILGSVERMSAILIEHYAGKWPFWLSPRQVMVVPVSDKFADYAKWVEKQLTLYGFYAECELSSKTLNKKVRESQLAQWNYICVVGEKEMTDLSVNVRQRDVERPLGTFSMTDFVAKLESEAMPTSQPLRQFEPFQGRSPAPTAAPAAAATPAPAAAAPKPAAAAAKPAAAAPKAKSQGFGTLRKMNSKEFAKSRFGALEVEDDVEHFLEDHPYVKGFTPTKADVELFNQLTESGFPKTPNLRRWFDHVGSFSASERAAWGENGA